MFTTTATRTAVLDAMNATSAAFRNAEIDAYVLDREVVAERRSAMLDVTAGTGAHEFVESYITAVLLDEIWRRTENAPVAAAAEAREWRLSAESALVRSLY